MAKPQPSIAATSTLAMIRTAEARGVETADLLERVGLSRPALEDPDTRLPAVTVLTIWNAMRERAGDPALQLVAPTSLPFGGYRVIDYLVGASSTVGEGIQRFAQFFRLIADAVRLTIDQDARHYCLTLTMVDGGPVPSVYVDYVFAALVSRIRMRINTDLQVARVELRVPEPENVAPYQTAFRAPVCFGAGADRLCFTPAEWNAPIPGADAALAQLLEEHARMLAQRVPVATSIFSTEVQKKIAAAPTESGSAAAIARALNMSVRTLQRKLVETGTTFRQVSDTVRGQLAEQYLADSHVSIAEVAFLLGFSDQSSFNRAFRRWTGESPGRWRERLAPRGSSALL